MLPCLVIGCQRVEANIDSNGVEPVKSVECLWCINHQGLGTLLFVVGK